MEASCALLRQGLGVLSGDRGRGGGRGGAGGKRKRQGLGSEAESWLGQWTALCLRCASVAVGIDSSSSEVLELLSDMLGRPALHSQLGLGVALLSHCLRRTVSVGLHLRGGVQERCLRVCGRLLTSAAGSSELRKHAYLLVGAVVDCLADQGLSAPVRELLLPGIFALVDACSPRMRKAVPATLRPRGRLCLQQLTQWYDEDFKFSGNN
jgi:hypothetical protein